MMWVLGAALVVVLVATALALAGRWNPQGLAAAASQPIDPFAADRFDVVLRGYRMVQVDREIERLHQRIAALESQAWAGPDAGSRPPDTQGRMVL